MGARQSIPETRGRLRDVWRRRPWTHGSHRPHPAPAQRSREVSTAQLQPGIFTDAQVAPAPVSSQRLAPSLAGTQAEALGIDPNNIKTNAKLYCNRGTVNSKLRKLEEAIDDCTNAIKLDDTYIKAYLRRAQCYMDTEQYEDAVRDYEKVYQTEKTKEHKQFLKNAQVELKKSKRKDYYKILGVDKNASEDEIKKAYRKRALMHHPDRHSGASAEIQKEEEKKFKEVGEAFTILSDPKKKARYDSGQDLDEDGMNMADFDANNIFKAFFGGPGGFSFEASGPGNFFFQFG
ncbi:dnaJ homolog subfamily C member 7 [Macrochelys suwanniensis]